MIAARWVSATAVLALALAVSAPHAVDAVATLTINQPGALALNLTARYPPHGSLPSSPAMFGIPFYGLTQTGVVIYANPPLGCTEIDTSSFPPPELGLLTILMIDRGGPANCTFRLKVKNCQDSGAVACIIADTQPNPNAQLPVMADDGKATAALVTPSVIIRKVDADLIKSYLVHGFVSMSVTFSLPNPDGHVEWDLWTSANDPSSHGFKHEFLQGIELLGSAHTFTPHYYILDGYSYGCVHTGRCGSQCTNDGRYCAVDPDANPFTGTSGADIIRENLRQMCVYRYLNATGDTIKWWHYVNIFGDTCGQLGKPWNASCSDSILTQLSIPQATITACEGVAPHGGFDNNVNDMLQAEMTLRPAAGIFHFPQLVINNELYWGSMSCPDPISVATCGPLTAVCAAFLPGTKPDACTGDADCPLAQTRDACGLCKLRNDPTRVDDPADCNPSKGGGVSLGYVVLVSVVGLLVLGGLLFWCIRRQKREVRRDVTNLLRAYVPLDANTAEQMRRDKLAPLSAADTGSAAGAEGHGRGDVEKHQLINGDREDSQVATKGQSPGGVSGLAVPPAPADEL